MRKRHLAATLLILTITSPAFALITGGETEPLAVRGLPDGSLPLVNLNTRIAWWQGPPYGVGRYQFEYAGETNELQKTIDLFDKIDSSRKEIVVREGEHTSYWLGIHDKDKKHIVDWRFKVWVPEDWQRLRDGGGGRLPPGEAGDSPKTVLTVFVTDRIKWDSLKIPKDLAVVDERLEANGIAADQGAALRGTVMDMLGNPVAGATVAVGSGTYKKGSTSDGEGRFLITLIPEGNHKVVVSAPGFASKDAYYHSFTRTTFQQMEVTLARSANVTVRVVDQRDKPLPGIEIRVVNCDDEAGNHYRIGGSHLYESDENGEFAVDDIPKGQIKFASRTRGYFYNSVLNAHDTNDSPIILKLQPTGTLEVSVVSASGEPVISNYLVDVGEQATEITKGKAIGSWGGTANIGEDGTYTFENVPPGRYAVTGMPNLGRIDDRTGPTNLVIEGGDHHSIKLIAK